MTTGLLKKRVIIITTTTTIIIIIINICQVDILIIMNTPDPTSMPYSFIFILVFSVAVLLSLSPQGQNYR